MAKNRSPFKILFFTQDYYYRKEADDINRLVSLTGNNIHLYKPKASISDVASLLKQLAPETLSKIVLHHHRSLAENFAVKGIHTPTNEQLTNRSISRSIKEIHSTAQILDSNQLEYYFFSPVFESISKKNHCGKFTIEQINAWVATQTQPIIALGGLDSTNIHQLSGFSGFAFKGAIWESSDPLAAANDLIKGICHEC